MTISTPILSDNATPIGQASTTSLRKVLHVGCGAANPAKLPEAFFPQGAWEEVRLDIDPGVQPDIIASITDMSVVPSGTVDAVWSAHNLEHLWSHEVPLALNEFRRVLCPGGFAAMTMPDLQSVAEQIVAGNLEGAAYMSALGPITPVDMLYGFRPAIAEGNIFMGHRTGYIATSLAAHLAAAGFTDVRVQRDGGFALWATAVNPG